MLSRSTQVAQSPDARSLHLAKRGQRLRWSPPALPRGSHNHRAHAGRLSLAAQYYVEPPIAALPPLFGHPRVYCCVTPRRATLESAAGSILSGQLAALGRSRTPTPASPATFRGGSLVAEFIPAQAPAARRRTQGIVVGRCPSRWRHIVLRRRGTSADKRPDYGRCPAALSWQPLPDGFG